MDTVPILDINLDIDAQTIADAKVHAARQGLSLDRYIVKIITDAVDIQNEYYGKAPLAE